MPANFLDTSVRGGIWSVQLPDGRATKGEVTAMDHDADGIVRVEGRLIEPEAGRFFFQRQTVEGVAGHLVGNIVPDRGEWGWKVAPVGPGGSPALVEEHRDGILCVGYLTEAPEVSLTEQAPQTHPSDIPIPSYQSVLPLQSLPGAVGVIYLDFDGEEGPFAGWGDFDAEAAGSTNSQIQQVWQMVAEDFQGFDLNVTTDRRVFDNAAEGRRQHVVVTPTTTAAPGSGGVSYIGSYNWSGDTVCWAFYSAGKAAAEVISHEVGHALGLSHDGREVDGVTETYYEGHGGTGPTGWAPIMGVGYSRNLTQWSQGEYSGANQAQDDLEIIASTNNDLTYRLDDAGATTATARYLEVFDDGAVTGEGIIETTGDMDAFRFSTTGGEVHFQIDPAESGPNLDILAELVEAGSGEVLEASNPDLELSAALSSIVPAGDYLLRVRGTGRGDPLVDGYTDYASLGTYLISGNVSGGVAAQRLSVVENADAGASVGFVAARLEHGESILSWSIASGNEGAKFVLDPLTGEIRVADPAKIDFEPLSTRWDEPAVIELLVDILDVAEPALNEQIRVVISVEDINEAPTVTDASLVMLERTIVGKPLLKVEAVDEDHFDFPEFRIIAGDPEQWFAIDAGTGELSVAAEIEVSGTTTLPLTIEVADQGTPRGLAYLTVTMTLVDIAEGLRPGQVVRTYFEGIAGSTVADLTGAVTWPDHPDSEEFLDDFDGDGHGDEFGSTIRGYLIPPATGTYRFWISSDDASELLLSSSADPAAVTTMATVSSWSKRYSWPNFGSQRSAYVTLTAGVPYYIEARHKEGDGGDHLAVAWYGPGFSKQLLKGLYVAPYRQNYAPAVVEESFDVAEEAFPGHPVGFVRVADVNLDDGHGDFVITGGNDSGLFEIDPESGELSVAPGAWLSHAEQAAHQLTIAVSDDGSPELSGSGTVTVNVLPAGWFANPGIYQQVWQGISLGTVASLTGNPRYPYHPDETRILTSFDTGENSGDNYGSRVRALLIPPVSGTYRFHLSSDDSSILLLGSSSAAGSATEVARIQGWSGYDEWTKLASQTSEPVNLTAGQKYYIEAVHKEGAGDDHLRVGWSGPGIDGIQVVPGSALQPYDLNTAPVFASQGGGFTLGEEAPDGSSVGWMSALDPEGESLVYTITEELSEGVFAIDPATGQITVADASRMEPGDHYLTVAAQDMGLGGLYPLKTTSRSVVITVESSNLPPAFYSESIELGGLEDQPVSYMLSAHDPDAGDVLIYEKISGPSWLVVEEDGQLDGVPSNGDVGSNQFTIRVTDYGGLFDEVILTIEVVNVNDPPVFVDAYLSLPDASEDQLYLTSLEGLGVDIDPQDAISYSKVAGPDWLLVSADGSLLGTPGNDFVGTNSLIVRATDNAGAYGEAMAVIEVINVNDPPAFLSPGISAVAANEGQAYFASIASLAYDPDAGDTLAFRKTSGPAWLQVSEDGTLSGTPAGGDAGWNYFGVDVRDPSGSIAGATLGIEVMPAYSPPSFQFDPVVREGGRELVGYTGASLSGSAIDPDAGQALVYAKIAGPGWLAVAEDGSLSGTPPAGSAGLNVFTVRASDPGGLFDEAQLLIEVASEGLPLPWQSVGIGIEGGVDQSDGLMEVTGSGNLSGRMDRFQYVWQPMATDGSITARVESMGDNADPGALAGVMIRDTLAGNSRHVFLGAAGDGSCRWVRRTGYNGNTSTSSSGSALLPDAWVRLVRTGSRITAFKSSDGLTWIQIGSLTAELPATCYFGLGVCSGSLSETITADFSHITLSP
nr:cadherin domain-containing protein [Luteolibacter marinus]